MNLDELRAEWAERDRQLNQVPLDGERLRQGLLAQHQREMRRLGWFDRYELIAGPIALALLGAFVWRHGQELKFLAPALALMVWCLVLPWLTQRQRQALRALDLGLPVLERQQRFEALRLQRLRTFQWAFLIGQLLWYIPFLIVFAKGLGGADLYQKAPGYLWSNLLGSLLFIPLSIAVARWLPARWWRGPRLRAFADQLAGRDIVQTRRALEQLRAFEQGDS